MSVIINDLSIDGQFSDVDEFCDKILEQTIPILDILNNLDINILKSYNTYDLNVTKEEKLINIMRLRGRPEITKLKSQLSKIFLDEPYWDSDIKSNTGSIYECEFTDELEGYCIAEALEREVPVLSFEHEKFNNDKILIKKDDIEKNVLNIYDNKNALDTFRDIGKISSFEYLCEKYKLKDSFGLSIGKNLFNDFVEEAGLLQEDVDIIIDDINKFIDCDKKGIHIDRYSDHIEGKINEFRTSITNNRQIRIFYFKKEDKIVFLNGFLKKTQKTPTKQIEAAKRMLEELDV